MYCRNNVADDDDNDNVFHDVTCFRYHYRYLRHWRRPQTRCVYFRYDYTYTSVLSALWYSWHVYKDVWTTHGLLFMLLLSAAGSRSLYVCQVLFDISASSSKQLFHDLYTYSLSLSSNHQWSLCHACSMKLWHLRTSVWQWINLCLCINFYLNSYCLLFSLIIIALPYLYSLLLAFLWWVFFAGEHFLFCRYINQREIGYVKLVFSSRVLVQSYIESDIIRANSACTFVHISMTLQCRLKANKLSSKFFSRW